MHSWENIQQTIDYIEAHLSENISIKKLAEIALLSPFYYQRLFSRLVKKPVAEYIKLRRLAKATELLQQRDKRILDVALDLGFLSHEHFTRSFKGAFGLTPDEYRNSPRILNRMTKVELSLNYTIIDEGIPLITEGIVLEINKHYLNAGVEYIGINKKTPVQFAADAGVESGIDPLAETWQTLHKQKTSVLGIKEESEEIGVAYPCEGNGFFNYFAGAILNNDSLISPLTSYDIPDIYSNYTLPIGEYVICSFEAESFENLVTDAIYKAQNYLFSMWLPKHGIQTEPFCAERYKSHFENTSSMEIWVKIK